MLFPSDLRRLPRDRMLLPPNDHEHVLAREFRRHIEQSSFPCVGAKAALSRGRLVTIIAQDIAAPGDDRRIHTALLGFVAGYRRNPQLFQSFAVIFEGAPSFDERCFERDLWARLQALCDSDALLQHPWDQRVASHVDNPHFSLSVAGEAFFVVGLHPKASRPARRFAAPVLVFNFHDQFERLRRDGRYDKMRASILERDKALAGSINPMLARHGSISEARQYSGRVVGDDWRCPFEGPQTEPHEEATHPAQHLKDVLSS